MVDAKSIFRSLTTGITFDKKRFKTDAQKFGLTHKKTETQTQAREFVFLPEVPIIPEPESEVQSLEEQSSSEDENELTLLGNISVKRKKKTKGKNDPKSKKSKLYDLHKQTVNRFRNVNRIHVFGSDIPDPIDSWQKLETRFGLSTEVVTKLSTRFTLPTPVQMQAIPLMLSKRQLLVCAPTGSGKTAAYLVPLIHMLLQKDLSSKKRPISAVIVSPTRELSLQIHRECSALCENTKLRPFVIDKVAKGMKKLTANQFDILITTPNRLVYMIKQEPSVISLEQVEHLIIDESDKLFEAGERGFRDQLAVIYRACGESGGIHTSMFSATMAADVEQWCKLNLDNPVTITIGERNRATDTVKQRLLYTTEKSKLQALKDLINEGLKPPVLVFVQSKVRAQELFDELAKEKELRVGVIHSDRSELQRDQTVKGFRSGRVWILICTELLGRGIDFKGVNMVVNYDFPSTSSSYIHRIGRTGRAGRSGEAVTFFTEKDVTLLRTIAQIIKSSGGEVPEYMLKLKKATRQEKRYLAKHQVDREQVKRESKYDQEKRLKLQRAIERTKRAKMAEKENVEEQEEIIEKGTNYVEKKTKKVHKIKKKKEQKITNGQISFKVSKTKKDLKLKKKLKPKDKVKREIESD